MTIIQIKAWLLINEKLTIEAIGKKDTNRLLELMLHKDILQRELINIYERKVS